MSRYDNAKLRPLEVKSFVHEGQPVFYLRDPLELSNRYALVPQVLGPLLATLDGHHTVAEMRQVFIQSTGQLISDAEIEGLLGQLDDIYLLDNENFATVKAHALAQYRAAPYRPPALAGASYPADPDALRRELQAFMDATPPAEPLETGSGLFCPHIDYARGGKVYAQLWKRARKLAQAAEVVVIFATDHNSFLPEQITPTRQNYATPFGVLPTEQSVVDAVVDVLGEENAFTEELNHRHEHSIELVVTWLHFIRDGKPVPIVPILVGSFYHFIGNGKRPADEQQLQAVLSAVNAATTAGRRVLTVASGDLAHLGPAFDTEPITPQEKIRLKRDDERMLQPLIAGDADGFFEIIRAERGERNVCGTAPFYLSLKMMGDVRGEVTGYDCCVADDRDTSFVSVAGMVFSNSE